MGDGVPRGVPRVSGSPSAAAASSPASDLDPDRDNGCY
jgi:hypothetical protein